MGGSINKREKKQNLFSKSLLGLYKRKLLFFVFVAVILTVVFMYLRYSQYQADQAYIDNPIASNSSKNITLLITDEGEILVDGQTTNRKLNSIPGFDELRIPIVDQPGRYYEKIIIEVTIPKSSAYKTEHQMLAIHGVDGSQSYIKDNSKIVYEATGVSSVATLSIVAKIPTGVINKPFYVDMFDGLAGVTFDYWLVLGIAIPILTIIFMIIFLVSKKKWQKVDQPDKAISSPPMAIPPALVGVLYHGQVGPREIAATLIDLARRKDIFILDKDRGFSFGKGKFDNRLLSYEKILLSKIFKNNLSTSRIQIEKKINEKIYSKKMSVVTAGIYSIATRLGYFQENPRKIYGRYQIIGIIAFLFGLAGFGASFFLGFLPSFTAFFWVGMMISALIVSFSARNVPTRTEIGTEALSNWLAFKKFLSDPTPVDYTPTVHQLFEAYLPYAIVLDCEAVWARRFITHNFIIPNWFVTTKAGLGIDDFCLSLFPIVSYVGRSLSELREPGYK